jgi:hypothetical protein
MDTVGIRLRESPRIEISGKARLQIGSTPALIDAALLDLSATGMGLATAVAVPKPAAGEPCAFDLALDGVRVEGRGVVIWSRRARPDRGDAPNVGVHFHQLEGEGESEVAAIVEQRLASARRPSVAARAIFAPVVERAVEPVPAQTEIAAPVSAPAEPVEEAPPVVSAAPPPSFGRREEPTSPAPDPPSPARRLLWVGVAGAAVVVAGLVMLGLFFGEQQSDPAPPMTVESIAEEPEPVDAAPAPVSEVLPATESRPEAPRAAVATLPDALAAAPAPAAAPPAAVPAVAPDTAGSDARARRLLAIEPSSGDGGEVVVLRADAPFRKQDVFAALMGVDPPRYLLRLSGIERQWRPPDLEVGSPVVQRVRTGLHSTPRGPELHVVLDLSTRAVDHSFEIEGEELRVRLRPRTP